MGPKHWVNHWPVFFLLISAAATAAPAVRNMKMTPGESISVQYPAGSEVKVSRKGVIDIFEVSDTTWQLTALRGGLVIVDAVDGSGTPQLPRLFIDVKSTDGPDRLPVTVGIPDWICQRKHIRCEQEEGVVSGTVHDYKWFLSARSWCNTSRSCRLFTTLTTGSRTELETFIKERINKDLILSVTALGDILITAICDPLTPEYYLKSIEAAFPHLLDSNVLTFQCNVSQAAYRITVKARKIAHSHGQTIGYDRDVDHTVISSPALTSTFAVKNKLKNEQIESESETLGEPTFLATANIEFSALIGGELPYASTNKHDVEEYRWKEYGLSIKGTIKSAQGNLIRSSIEVFLKSVQDQPAKGLNTSSIKSNFETIEGQWSLIGELELNLALNNESRTMFLASIPIIGPLFRLNQSSKSDARLQTWIKIDRADAVKSDFNDNIELQGLPAKGKI